MEKLLLIDSCVQYISIKLDDPNWVKNIGSLEDFQEDEDLFEQVCCGEALSWIEKELKMSEEKFFETHKNEIVVSPKFEYAVDNRYKKDSFKDIIETTFYGDVQCALRDKYNALPEYEEFDPYDKER